MTDPIIDRLDQIKSRADKATPGPWFESPHDCDPVWSTVVTGGVDENEEDQGPLIEPRAEEGLLVLSIAASMISESMAEMADVLVTFAKTFKESVDQSWGKADE